jgi:hypothetical protein
LALSVAPDTKAEIKSAASSSDNCNDSDVKSVKPKSNKILLINSGEIFVLAIL